MTGVPWHPALVHVPLGLSLVMPLLGLGLAWTVWTGRFAPRTWAIAVALQAILLGSALTALRTGQAEEERVESVVGEVALERHEDAALLFVWSAAGALVLAAAVPFLPAGRPWRTGLIASALGFVAVAALAVGVGHAGGELVYAHGAAAAYGAPAAPASGGAIADTEGGESG